MKRLLVLLLFIGASSGCGIFKKRSVDLKHTSFSSAKELKLKVDSTEHTTDKSVYLETKKADTTVTTPEVKNSTSTNFTWEEIADGLTTVDSSLVSVKVTLDTGNKKIKTEVTLKPRKVPVKIDVSKAAYINKTSDAVKHVDQQNKEATEAQTKAKATVAEPKGLGWLWAIIVAGFIIISGLVIYLAKRYFPKK